MPLIHPGVQIQVLAETPVAAGVTERVINIQSDSLLLALSIGSISGSLTLDIVAEVLGNETTLYTTTVNTTGLVINTTPVLPSTVTLRMTYTGSCSYEVQARAVSATQTQTAPVSSEVVLPPTISNISIPLANTEYSIVIPAGTKQIELFERTGARIQYAFESGDSGTEFSTLPPWSYKNLSNFDVGIPVTIYFQANRNGSILELTTWT